MGVGAKAPPGFHPGYEYKTSQVSDVLWEELAAIWTSAQLIELLMLAGWYRAISYVCNAARVPLEDWQARFPSR